MCRLLWASGLLFVASTALFGQTDLAFVPVTPCRVVDTRGATGPLGGPAISANATRSFPLPTGSCGLPANASTYSLNVTVVPHATLQYLTLWPTGQSQPLVSTLNSLDGRVVANAAIVPAGTSGSVSVYVTNQTDVILDVNGYFSPAGSTPAGLAFVPVTPCRVEDTRNPTGTFGGPALAANSSRSFPIPSSACSIPSSAAAYSLNETVVPATTLQYLTLYPTGASQPVVSTLNSPNGQVVANAALVPAGTGGAVTAYATDQTNLISDINGYFTATPASPLIFNAITPCRVLDTRNAAGPLGGPVMAANSTRSFPIPSSPCGLPASAAAYVFNVTVVPTAALQYLTLWPSGESQPTVSTLNSENGQVVANAAIVPAGTSGAIDVYVTNQTNVILDTVGYFSAPPPLTYTNVTIPANNNIQTAMISTFPTGTFLADNILATPFNISSAAGNCGPGANASCNFYDGFGYSGSGAAITMTVSIVSPTDAYTLMNAYRPASGQQLATIEFVGTGGASVTFPLIGGSNIRDFYQGVYANSLTNGVSGVTTFNAFTCSDPSNCLGAGGTGNVNTGLTGTYVVDEQHYSLGNTFAGKTLTQIIITDTYNGSNPILLGLTVAAP